MKRDMDLIRQILFAIEKQPFTGRRVTLDINGYSNDMVSYHIILLHEAGLIDAVNFSSKEGPRYFPTRLTWQGHEFLEAIKDDTRWNKVKSIMEKAGGFAYEIAKVVAIDLMKNQIFPSP
jgi:predicted transcriptional regulator